MHISAPFIRRPVATSLLSVALLLGGAVGYVLLPVSSLPEVEFPTINVQAQLPGASPETAASAIATPLERQFGRIAGVTEMTSSSTLGGSNITLQFDLNRNIDGAARDVQAAINAARAQLPANLPQNPRFYKSNPADAPIMILALTSDQLSRPEIYDAADSVLQQKISQVPGVGESFVGGGASPAVRVEANPMQLSSYGIGLESLRTTLGAVNQNMATGYFRNSQRISNINTNDQLFQARNYAPLVVGYNPATGAAVRLEDVASVIDSTSNLYTSGLANGKPAVLIIIFKIAGANVIETVDRRQGRAALA